VQFNINSATERAWQCSVQKFCDFLKNAISNHEKAAGRLEVVEQTVGILWLLAI
jgi:hypothetical protein